MSGYGKGSFCLGQKVQLAEQGSWCCSLALRGCASGWAALQADSLAGVNLH